MTTMKDARIAAANKALDAGGYDDSPDDAIVDLVTDLLHLAHAQGFGANEILRRAGNHFEAEKNTDEPLEV